MFLEMEAKEETPTLHAQEPPIPFKSAKSKKYQKTKGFSWSEYAICFIIIGIEEFLKRMCSVFM